MQAPGNLATTLTAPSIVEYFSVQIEIKRCTRNIIHSSPPILLYANWVVSNSLHLANPNPQRCAPYQMILLQFLREKKAVARRFYPP